MQTGVGRTGRFWGHDHFGVRPDILITAKGLASGFPLSGIAAPEALMDKARPGSQGGTYGGNAVACAAAVATLEVVEEEGLVANAAAMGARLRSGLEDVAAKTEAIGDVRGLGLMLASEFTTPDGEPDAATARTRPAGRRRRGTAAPALRTVGQRRADDSRARRRRGADRRRPAGLGRGRGDRDGNPLTSDGGTGMTTTHPTPRVVEDVPKQLLIGGRLQDAAGGRTFPVDNPATGESLCEVADAGPDDGRRAAEAAAAAQESWAATAPRARSEILRRAYEIIISRTDDLALLMTLEMGKPLAEARGEVAYAAEFFRWFSEEAVRIEGGFAPSPDGRSRHPDHAPARRPLSARHPLELPARHGHPQDRPGRRRGLHHGPQARPADTRCARWPWPGSSPRRACPTAS